MCQLLDFRQLLSGRAKQYNWNADGGILRIPENVAAPLVGDHVDIIDHYGERTIEQIRAYEETHIATQTRMVQDTHMLYDLLKASITPAARLKVTMWEEEYHMTPAASATASGAFTNLVNARASAS